MIKVLVNNKNKITSYRQFKWACSANLRKFVKSLRFSKKK